MDQVHQNMGWVHKPLFLLPHLKRLLVYDCLYILVKCFVVSSFEITKFAELKIFLLWLYKQCQLQNNKVFNCSSFKP